MSQEIIDNLIVEKTALDQSLCKSILESLELRKLVLLKDKAINDLNKQIQDLLKDKESLQAKINELSAEPVISIENKENFYSDH